MQLYNIQSGFEYLRGWGLLNLSWQFVLESDHCDHCRKKKEFSCISIWIYCLLSFGWVLMRRIWLHLLYHSHQVFLCTDQMTLNLPFSRINACSLLYSSYIRQSNPLDWCVAGFTPVHLPLVLGSQELGTAHHSWAEGKGHCPQPTGADVGVLCCKGALLAQGNTRTPPVLFHEIAM